MMCLFIIAVFTVLVFSTLNRLLEEKNPYVILSTSGLITGFGLQAFVNMGSSLHLIPTKGMTLPFISYGGSSAISVALTIGMALALTRHRVEGGLFTPPSSSAETARPLTRSLHKDH